MPDAAERFTPATAEDLADALAFVLRFNGRQRVHGADELRSAIVDKRFVEHLERSGFILTKKPPIGAVRRRELNPLARAYECATLRDQIEVTLG